MGVGTVTEGAGDADVALGNTLKMSEVVPDNVIVIDS